MEEKVQDYLFDLQGYLVLEGAICNEDLQLINQWIDDHWEYIENPWIEEGENGQDRSRWIGNIQTHTYNIENGVNFQNVIEGGEVFEKLIDHPSWISLVKKYVNSVVNGLSIHENFITVRGTGCLLYTSDAADE